MTRSRSTARGRVWKWRDTWHHEVTDSKGKVVLEDNALRWSLILEDCQEATAAVQVVENAGHRLRYSYDQLVDGVKL